MSEQQELQRHPGETALAALDTVLEERPNKDSHELALAIQALSRLRDHLIAALRQGAAPEMRDRLDRTNAILSVAAHAEYPLVGVRWKRVQVARDALAGLLGELQAH